MAFIEFPQVLIPLTRNLRIDARTRSPGESINGREQIQYSGLSRWVGDLEVPLNQRDRILAFQSLQAALVGRMNYTNVTFIAGVTAPKILPMINGVVYRGNRLVPPPGKKLSDLGKRPRVGPAALTGANRIRFDPGTCEGIAPGCDFSINNRLYRVVKYDEIDVVTVEPSIREFIPAFSYMEFWRPSCLMGLVADDSMNGPLTLGRFGTGTMQFVEYW